MHLLTTGITIAIFVAVLVGLSALILGVSTLVGRVVKLVFGR